MAKRKKIKKAGSTSRNIHKIATTLGIVPLVTMSSFLFQDSYALAVGPTLAPKENISIMIDLSNYDNEMLGLNNFFTAGSASYISLTGSIPIQSTASTGVLKVNASSPGSIELQPHAPGTSLVTIHATTDYHNDVSATFRVTIFDPALTTDALDTQRNGFDIADIVKAIDTQNPAADLNGDGVVNRTDAERLLTFLPASHVNSNPSLINDNIHVPDISVKVGQVGAVDFNSYFHDVDADQSLIYRVYPDDPANISPAIFTSSTFTANSIEFFTTSAGSRAYTVVADDQHGGSRIEKFTVTATLNHPPVVLDDKLKEIIFSGVDAEYNLSQLFSDPDGDELDYAVSIIASHSLITYTSGGRLSVQSDGSWSANAIITADDDHNTGTGYASANLQLRILNPAHPFTANGQGDSFLRLSNYFQTDSPITIVSPGASNIAEVSLVEREDAGILSNIEIKGKQKGTITFTLQGKDADTGVIGVHKTFVLKIVDGNGGAGELPPVGGV